MFSINGADVDTMGVIEESELLLGSCWDRLFVFETELVMLLIFTLFTVLSLLTLLLTTLLAVLGCALAELSLILLLVALLIVYTVTWDVCLVWLDKLVYFTKLLPVVVDWLLVFVFCYKLTCMLGLLAFLSKGIVLKEGKDEVFDWVDDWIGVFVVVFDVVDVVVIIGLLVEVDGLLRVVGVVGVLGWLAVFDMSPDRIFDIMDVAKPLLLLLALLVFMALFTIPLTLVFTFGCEDTTFVNILLFGLVFIPEDVGAFTILEAAGKCKFEDTCGCGCDCGCGCIGICMLAVGTDVIPVYGSVIGVPVTVVNIDGLIGLPGNGVPGYPGWGIG